MNNVVEQISLKYHQHQHQCFHELSIHLACMMTMMMILLLKYYLILLYWRLAIDVHSDLIFQAQLVIDTSSSTATNALLPYTIVPGSNSTSTMDNYDPSHENHSINPSSSSQQQQQQQQQQHYHDEPSSMLD